MVRRNIIGNTEIWVTYFSVTHGLTSKAYLPKAYRRLSRKAHLFNTQMVVELWIQK
jgi:hypothetical protein